MMKKSALTLLISLTCFLGLSQTATQLVVQTNYGRIRGAVEIDSSSAWTVKDTVNPNVNFPNVRKNGRMHIHPADMQLYVWSVSLNRWLPISRFTSVYQTKLDGIATGATANQTDAYLTNRSNHTGTQPASTITGLPKMSNYVLYTDTFPNKIMTTAAALLAIDSLDSELDTKIPNTSPAASISSGDISLWNSSIQPSDTTGMWYPASGNPSDFNTVSRTNDSIASVRTLANSKVSVATLSSYSLANGSNATGTWSVNTSGNSGTATKLATARNINGVPFDGTANITVPGTTYTAGTGIDVSGTVISNTSPNSGSDSRSGYGTGTPYSLTTTSAKITMGTTSPTVTLPSAGTYMIISNLKLDYSGLTSLASSTSSFKLRRTNNTAADIPNATTTFTSPIVTLLTGPAGDADMQGVIYTTSTSGDVIEMWGNRGAGITVGNLNVSEAWIIAIRIY